MGNERARARREIARGIASRGSGNKALPFESTPARAISALGSTMQIRRRPAAPRAE